MSNPINLYRFVSLRDMLVKYAFLYCLLQDQAFQIEDHLKMERQQHPTGKILMNPPKDDTAIMFLLNSLCREELKVNIPSVKAQILRIKEKIRHPFDLDEMIALLKELRTRLQDDLESQNFFYVPDNMVTYHEKENLFGTEVTNRFPAAAFDIEEAGKCLALGRATACAFHLMRIVEIGLKELASSLAVVISDKCGWLAILSKIEPAIGLIPDPERKKSMEQARAHLHAIRLAWRNDTMHVKAIFTEEEARRLFDHTDTFMRHLSGILKHT